MGNYVSRGTALDTRRSLTCTFAVLALFLPASNAHAAKPKPLEKFTGCLYVENRNNDGDSFRVKCGEKEFVLRLYFIDAPETTLRNAEQARKQGQHFGISLDDTLVAGAKAADFVRATLSTPFEVWTKWTVAGGQGKEGRYYAFVEVQGKSLIELMVRGGFARVFGSVAPLPDGRESTPYKAMLKELEDDARTKRVGAWSNTKQ